MSDNFNINTTQDQSLVAGGLDTNNPAMTYVDFANQITKAEQEQRRQEQMINQATELAKQEKLSTKQKTQADAMGVNPEMKDFFTVDEAVSYLKAASVDDKLIESFVASLNGKQIVSRAAIDTIIRKKEAQAKTGIPFIASAEDARNESLVTKEGDNLVAGQSYFDTGEKDEEGNAIYGHGGKEPVDQEHKLKLKEEEAAEKQWQKLDMEINKFLRSSRGNGLTTAVQRSVRALNELGEGQPLTSPVLSYIQRDISGIFQGGVPTVAGMDQEDFTNTMQKINNIIAKYTGVQGYFHKDLGDQREYLLGLLMRLRDTTMQMLKASVASESTAYEQIIHGEPDRWTRMVDGKTHMVESGLSENAKTTMDAMKDTPQGQLKPALTPKAKEEGQPDVHALANALGLKKKAK